MFISTSSLVFALLTSSVVALGEPGHSHNHHKRHAKHRSEIVVERADAVYSHGVDMSVIVERHAQPDNTVIKKRKNKKRKSCRAPVKSASSLVVSSAAPSPTAPVIAAVPKPVDPKPTSTKEVKPQPTPTPAPSPSKPDPPKGNVGGAPFKPADWPTVTQAGASPTIVVANAADPMLATLSHAYNNAGNKFYEEEHVGQLTYYGQGLGACGDTYDDSSYTAAVSMLMFDAWPGASASQNLNPICGPFVPGRKTIAASGAFKAAAGLGDGSNYALIGGDGRINCDAVTQCHIPLTATVTHGGKSIIVKIVDRCVGCAVDDIDLTPTAYAAIADPALGRTDVKWHFNKY